MIWREKTPKILNNSKNFRFSPKTVMLNGMLAQIFFGVICGQTKYFELHALLRCLVAACCSAMVASGQMISKYKYWSILNIIVANTNSNCEIKKSFRA